MSSRTTRLALVTGGTRGIGGAIASRLHRDGHHVVITGTKENFAGSEKLEYIPSDLGDEGALSDLLHWIGANAPEIVVNNAGINIPEPIEQLTLDAYDKMHRINLRAPTLICRAAIGPMRKNHWGRIVNISSIWSVTVKEHRAAYCASKFGLVGMSKALAVEVAADGILVNCIAPGYIETEATRSAFDVKELQEAASTIPIKRFGRPDEVAALASWLASNDNGYLTGQNILLDGGLSSI